MLSAAPSTLAAMMAMAVRARVTSRAVTTTASVEYPASGSAAGLSQATHQHSGHCPQHLELVDHGVSFVGEWCSRSLRCALDLGLGRCQKPVTTWASAG